MALALVLMAFSVVGAAGTMRCFFGLPMEEMVAVAAPVEASDCCPSKIATPDPAPSRQACCCVDVMEKSIIEVNAAAPVVFVIDFPILDSPAPSFEFAEVEVPVQQIRWPEVHGPPGIERIPASPRAPPVA